MKRTGLKMANLHLHSNIRAYQNLKQRSFASIISMGSSAMDDELSLDEIACKLVLSTQCQYYENANQNQFLKQ